MLINLIAYSSQNQEGSSFGFVILGILLIVGIVIAVTTRIRRNKWKHQDPNEIGQSVLEAGESLVKMQRFNIPKNANGSLNSGSTLALLTNRCLHFVRFRMTYGQGLQIASHSTIPLSNVSSITTKEFAVLTLSFQWENHQETLLSQPKERESALEFANSFKQLVTSRETIAGATSVADELAKLSQLAEEGILTQEEMTKAKEMFFGKPPNQIDESIRLLRNLRDLQKQGVLSESEFNMKKWDVLSKKEFT